MAGYVDPHLAGAWEKATSGAEFVAALNAQGYSLAQGRKRLVVVDPHGKAHNPMRHLKGVRAKDLYNRLSDIDLTKLPDAAALQAKKQFQMASRGREAAIPKPPKVPIETLEEKHRKEEAALRSQHSRRMKTTKSSLVAFYDLAQRKAALTELGARVRQASWWKQLLGLWKPRLSFMPSCLSKALCRACSAWANLQSDFKILALGSRIKEWASRGDARQRALRHDLVTLCVCPQLLPCKRPSASWCAREHGVSRQWACRLQQEFACQLGDRIKFRGQRFQTQ